MFYVLYSRRARYILAFVLFLIIMTEFATQAYNATLSLRDRDGLVQKKRELEAECADLQSTVKRLRDEDVVLIESLARGMGYVREGEVVEYSAT